MALTPQKKNIILLTALLVALMLGFGKLGSRHAESEATGNYGESGETMITGDALIGGPFQLTTSTGETFTQENLKGHYSLVFFGFSNCPDMCPTALSTLTAALDAAPKALTDQLTPIFISVDPERDTPEKLKAYAANFYPTLVALTGTPEQVKQAANAFKVFFTKAEVMKDKDGNYMVNHSGYLYLMGKNGEYLKHFPHTISSDDLLKALQETVQK